MRDNYCIDSFGKSSLEIGLRYIMVVPAANYRAYGLCELKKNLNETIVSFYAVSKSILFIHYYVMTMFQELHFFRI